MEAAENAVKEITNEEADEYFVIVLSDANLDRYGIRPRHLTDALTAKDDVNAYIIFIGSLGDQATRFVLIPNLPRERESPATRLGLCPLQSQKDGA